MLEIQSQSSSAITRQPRYLLDGMKLSLLAVSRCRSLRIVCMSSFKPRRRTPGCLVPVRVVIFSVFGQSRGSCRCFLYSKSGIAGQCLSLAKLSSIYIVQRFWTLQSSSSISHRSILYSLLLDSFISVLSTTFQHALFTFFSGFKLGDNDFRGYRCPSRVSCGQTMYQLCI